MTVSTCRPALARTRMRNTLGRSQSRSRILREYLPNRIVDSSTDISDELRARNSRPFRETVHLPSNARRIFRSSDFIACDYSKQVPCDRYSLRLQSVQLLGNSAARSLP